MPASDDPTTCFNLAKGGTVSERNAAVSFEEWDHETAAKAGDGMIPPPALKERLDPEMSALLFLKEILPFLLRNWTMKRQKKQVVG